MEKKLLLAVVLSIVVMLGYPLFIAKVLPPAATDNIQNGLSQHIDNKNVIEKIKVREVAVDANVNSELPEGALIVPFSTARYDLEISDIGGSIQKLSIKDSARLDIDLVEKAIFGSGIMAIEGDGPFKGLSSQPFNIQTDTASFQSTKDGLTIDKSIKFFENSYGFVASIKITNVDTAPKKLSFQITTASNISTKEIYESRYIEAGIHYNDDKTKRLSGGKLKNSNELRESNIKWIYLKNKYYSIICEPDFATAGIFTRSVNGNPVLGLIINDGSIQPGETKTYDLKYYIGPTEINELEKVDKSFGKALNFGFFTSISLILLSILKFFYSLFHNYGISILLLTFCISLLLFPLTFKSLSSMRRLQELQPKIEKIRSECKDNPQKLNKEIMEVYRRHKVNPMGGCMPMFLQMPIFLALYQTLMRSVELKGAEFLWIKDLSMPDAAFDLPFTVPFLGSAINILPILMIGAMIIQQKMSQVKTAGAQTEQQRLMSSIMPVMFGFIFYNLPSGLVLYWLTNTLLTSGLQFLAVRKT
jgi:YidC/Oxa1 family membrane protein insertase